MDITSYLQRIEYDGEFTPGLDQLAKLQEQHLLTVPFENLDTMLGRKVILDLPAIYRKVVLQQRGGFCYELNSLFRWLLNELGFKAKLLSGEVASTQSEDGFGRPFDHMTILVQLEQDYLVDVGFGDSARRPIPFTGEEITDVSGTYRIIPNEEQEKGFFLQKKDDGQWKSRLRFTTEPRQLNQFKEMCHYHQTSPRSSFSQRPITTIATREGRITLTKDSLTVTADGEKEQIPINSEDERKQMLQEYFGISLD